jgi:hypothetical protein
MVKQERLPLQLSPTGGPLHGSIDPSIPDGTWQIKQSGQSRRLIIRNLPSEKRETVI